MKLFVVFAQRKELYPGQYAPEATAVVSEYDYDENPDWLQDMLAEARADDDIVSADIFEIDLGASSDEFVRKHLLDALTMAGTVRVAEE